ncbi:MAG TPA: mRNA surveillance protein pelota [Candidatus Nanoarchaeia archaeon]|nr:mRNA surveillance protein pelota [Candidatus Nanoarchaeia archaeon]
MQLITSDFKKGLVKLKVTDKDDLWYLSHLIDQGDLVRGKTTRKIKIGEGENAKSVKKTLTISIQAETIELTENSLRINGKVTEETEDVPKGSYQSTTLEEASEFSIEKPQWLSYQKQKLQEACEKKYDYLLCLFDREEVLFALTKKFGYEILTTLKGEVQKKAKAVEIKKDFQEEIIKTLETYNDRYKPSAIILASPAFYKEDLYKKIPSSDLKKKIVLATCSDISERSLDEVMRRPELAETLKHSRARQEQILVEELLKEINKSDKAVYGLKEVQEAANSGSILKLLLTDDFIQKKRLSNEFAEVDQCMKTVDSLQGEIHIISAESDAGKKLNGLGGIAGILRYKKY